jgi:hypothetical protein
VHNSATRAQRDYRCGSVVVVVDELAIIVFCVVSVYGYRFAS